MLNPIDFNLPQKFNEYRNGQLEVAAKISTTGRYCFMLDAPTGIGKSLIAATTQRLMNKKLVYLCTTKQLQDQLISDFPYARTLKGRNNYPCLKYKNMYPQISAEECSHAESNPCEQQGACPYAIAKREAIASPLAVLNMSYFLTEANYVGTFSDLEMLVVDEADTLEDHLMSFVDVTITQKQLDQLGLAPPKFKTKFESWVEWANEAVRILNPRITSIQRELEGYWSTVDFALIKEEKYLSRLLAKLSFFVREVDKNWVWYPQSDRWSFKPVWVAKYAENSFWKHSKKVLMMSATILDYVQVCRNVGLDANRVLYKQLPSPFPKENRPVFLDYVGVVTRKTMDTVLPKVVEKTRDIMVKHREDKVLVHCVTYDIANYLKNHLNSNRVMTHGVFDKEQVLEAYKKSSQPRVLLSPSMERGVDLPDDQCRAIVIVKVPYPYLGDPQISKRVHASQDGNSWYAHKTISRIIQMAGRGDRSFTDYASTYILDAKFDDLYSDYKRMFSQWFREAIVR